MHENTEDDIAHFDDDGDNISIAHRAAEQREYESAYREWVTTLSPSERATLKSQGFDKPDGDIQQINGKRRSVEEMDLPQPEAAQVTNQNIIVRVLLDLTNCDDMPRQMDVMLSALGAYDCEGLTCEALAKRHGISKQRFCYLRTRFIDAYNLPPPQNGRDIKIRTIESSARCQKSNSPSISQRKSASYTKASRKRLANA